MEPGQPDVAQQLPAGGGVNKPASGTYGEGAALDRLKSQLPGEAADQVSQVVPPPAPTGPAPLTAPTPGLPRALLAPSRGVPATTPLTVQAEPQVGPSAELVRVAQALLRRKESSPTAREWARIVLGRLDQRQSQQAAPAPAPMAGPSPAY